jgi:hypothetical protein
MQPPFLSLPVEVPTDDAAGPFEDSSTELIPLFQDKPQVADVVGSCGELAASIGIRVSLSLSPSLPSLSLRLRTIHDSIILNEH